MKFNSQVKVLLVVGCFILSVLGFMIKLPSVFRHYDKELHALFYFLAAAFLNLLFAKRNIIIHALIFIVLYFFSVSIEYAQEYSNKFFRRGFHGRYDVEDVAANLKGLVLFSVLWLAFTAIMFVYRNISTSKVESRRQAP